MDAAARMLQSGYSSDNDGYQDHMPVQPYDGYGYQQQQTDMEGYGMSGYMQSQQTGYSMQDQSKI